MVQHLFPRFLSDPAEYAQAETYWRDLWDEMARFAGQQQDWKHPWLPTAYADGTPFRDGDPIFSAWSPRHMRGVRVIQNEPTSARLELDIWTEVVGDRWTGEVQTLVISCALSKQAANLARDLISSWMRNGKAVSIAGGKEGLPLVGLPPEDPLLRLRNAFPPLKTEPAPLLEPVAA